MLTIEEIKERVTPVLKAYDVKAAYLFGSYARGDATENSDVDIRVDSGNSPKLRGWAYGGLYLDLKEALDCELDLLTCLPKNDKPLSKYFLANLKKDEVQIYG